MEPTQIARITALINRVTHQKPGNAAMGTGWVGVRGGAVKRGIVVLGPLGREGCEGTHETQLSTALALSLGLTVIE